MRVTKDSFADVTIGGVVVHTHARTLLDDTGRVAVFTKPNQPPTVYQPGEAVVTRWRGGNCSHPVCYGKMSRMAARRLMEKTVTVDAV